MWTDSSRCGTAPSEGVPKTPNSYTSPKGYNRVMSKSRPNESSLRAARREMAICGLLLAGAIVVVFFASRGTFTSMMMFPQIFAGIVSVVALLTLLTARGVLWKPRAALVAAVIAVAFTAPIVHKRTFTQSLLAKEDRAMEVLGGRVAPEIPFLAAYNLDSKSDSPFTLDTRDRLTLVNFWSTTCSACVEEFPELKKLWAEYGESGIDVVGVTKLYDAGDEVQAELDHIAEFLDYHDLKYPSLVAEGDSPAHRDYRVASLPSSVLIDADGTVLAYGAGLPGGLRLMEQARELLAASGDD